MASILDVYGHEFSVWVGHRHLRLHDLDPGNMETVASLPGNLGISAWIQVLVLSMAVLSTKILFWLVVYLPL